MSTNPIIIETALAPQDLINKLKSITITDLSKVHESPLAAYYGEIGSHSFDIKNVRYGPMSSAPGIQGEITEGINSSKVNVTIDIESHYKMIRSMYYATLIPIGIIVMLISTLVLGGTEFHMHGILFSCAYIVCAFLFVALMKGSLVATKRKELNAFASRIEGQIMETKQQELWVSAINIFSHH